MYKPRVIMARVRYLSMIRGHFEGKKLFFGFVLLKLILFCLLEAMRGIFCTHKVLTFTTSCSTHKVVLNHEIYLELYICVVQQSRIIYSFHLKKEYILMTLDFLGQAASDFTKQAYLCSKVSLLIRVGRQLKNSKKNI